MKAAFLAGFVAVIGVLLSPAGRVAAQEQPAAFSPAAGKIVPLDIYPLPDRIATFGKWTKDSIRVLVLGGVNQVGIHYLPPESVVRDAIENAGGASEFLVWSGSGILRPVNAGQGRLLRFTRATRQTDVNTPLEDGDRIYFATEAY